MQLSVGRRCRQNRRGYDIILLMKTMEKCIYTIVAVLGGETCKILPPCGNCRQMMYLYDQNMNVIVSEDTKVSIQDLLKYPCD